MTYECQLIDRPAQPAMVIHTRAKMMDLPLVLGKGFQGIGEFLSFRGLEPSGPPFVAYLNMDMEDLNIQIGLPVAEAVHGAADVVPFEIPAGMAVTCLHVGPYAEVGKAYDAINAFVQERNLQPSPIAYEFYLNDPVVTPQAELQTEVVIPLQGAPA